MTSDTGTRFGPADRARALERLTAETFDVVVIGGGVTGCGAALDAASRGLSVALVEKRDFAAGTSSRSSKLIHGGLRYLENFDIGLVREALHERRLLVEKITQNSRCYTDTAVVFIFLKYLQDKNLRVSGVLVRENVACD